jgi:hypothetical protein
MVPLPGAGAGAGAAGTAATGAPLAPPVAGEPSLPPPPHACTASTSAATDQRYKPAVLSMGLFFMRASLSTVGHAL